MAGPRVMQPFSLGRKIDPNTFDIRPQNKETDPKDETPGSSEQRAQEEHPTDESVQTPLTPGSVTATAEDTQGSLSASDAPSESSAKSTESEHGASTEPGQEQTKTIEKPTLPLVVSPTIQTSPTTTSLTSLTPEQMKLPTSPTIPTSPSSTIPTAKTTEKATK